MPRKNHGLTSSKPLMASAAGIGYRGDGIPYLDLFGFFDACNITYITASSSVLGT